MCSSIFLKNPKKIWVRYSNGKRGHKCQFRFSGAPNPTSSNRMRVTKRRMSASLKVLPAMYFCFSKMASHRSNPSKTSLKACAHRRKRKFPYLSHPKIDLHLRQHAPRATHIYSHVWNDGHFGIEIAQHYRHCPMCTIPNRELWIVPFRTALAWRQTRIDTRRC